MLAEAEGHTEWVAEERGSKYQRRPRDQLQKQGLKLTRVFLSYFFKNTFVHEFVFFIMINSISVAVT